MIWASRNRKGPDEFLDWRIRLFFVGAVLALLGMGTGQSWLVGVAIGVLVVAMILRFISGGRGSEDDGGSRDAWDEDGGGG